MEEYFRELAKRRDRELQSFDAFGAVRPIIDTIFKGYRIVAVGNSIFYSEKWKTFPDFLFDYIKLKLGDNFGNAEINKPLSQRHMILQWYDALCHFQRRGEPNDKGIRSGIPNGASAAYLNLAYDLYILDRHQSLPSSLLQRLKSPDHFQGARYELFAAATFIRAGFYIQHEDETDGSKTHPEFIATHPKILEDVAVEAKSKHRQGVLGYPGNPESPEQVRIRVGGLIDDALGKRITLPYVIFVDMNLPPSAMPGFEEFVQAISDLLNQKKREGADHWTILVFTNYPFHYGEDDQIYPLGRHLVIKSKIPKNPAMDISLNWRLTEALEKYGNIPNEFPSTFPTNDR